MNKFARFALVIMLLVACFPKARSSALPTVPSQSGESWLNGAAGYARAVELQKERNVPLVVYFYTDWCPYCRNLDNLYLPAAPVQDYLRGVVKVRINPEHGPAERALANRYGVSGYPSFFVMRHAETRPVNVNPFGRVSNLAPAEFANACRAVAPISQKVAAGRSSGASGKFRGKSREKSEVVTKVTITKGGGTIVTVVPAVPVSRKAGGKKQ
jgi:thiol-disulfide isomerase/thioredoxin